MGSGGVVGCSSTVVRLGRVKERIGSDSQRNEGSVASGWIRGRVVDCGRTGDGDASFGGGDGGGGDTWLDRLGLGVCGG